MLFKSRRPLSSRIGAPHRGRAVLGGTDNAVEVEGHTDERRSTPRSSRPTGSSPARVPAAWCACSSTAVSRRSGWWLPGFRYPAGRQQRDAGRPRAQPARHGVDPARAAASGTRADHWKCGRGDKERGRTESNSGGRQRARRCPGGTMPGRAREDVNRGRSGHPGHIAFARGRSIAARPARPGCGSYGLRSEHHWARSAREPARRARRAHPTAGRARLVGGSG